MSPLKHRSAVQHTGKPGMDGCQRNAGRYHRLPGGRHCTVPLRMRHGKTTLDYTKNEFKKLKPELNQQFSIKRRYDNLAWLLQASFQSCMDVYEALNSKIAKLLMNPTLVVSVFIIVYRLEWINIMNLEHLSLYT